MPFHRVVDIIDGEPTFEKPLKEIMAELNRNGGLQTLDPVDFITKQQRNWYKGVCLPFLAKHDENQETKVWWDTEVKKKCGGLDLLKPEYKEWADGNITSRLTTSGVGKKKMTQFIENILSKSLETGWCVPPPDSDLRK